MEAGFSITYDFPFEKTSGSTAVETVYVYGEYDVRPGSMVMVDELVTYASFNVAEREAESREDRGLSFNFAEAAWVRIDEQRNDPECYYIGMDLHSDNVVVTILQSRFERDTGSTRNASRRSMTAARRSLPNLSTSARTTRTSLASSRPTTSTSCSISSRNEAGTSLSRTLLQSRRLGLKPVTITRIPSTLPIVFAPTACMSR